MMMPISLEVFSYEKWLSLVITLKCKYDYKRKIMLLKYTLNSSIFPIENTILTKIII